MKGNKLTRLIGSVSFALVVAFAAGIAAQAQYPGQYGY